MLMFETSPKEFGGESSHPYVVTDAHEHRIDIGLNDWAYQKQLSAIQSFNLNPILQDMSSFSDPGVLVPPPEVRRDLVSEALWFERTANKKDEEYILSGTNLSDKFLRAFQEDYVPYQAAAAYSSPNAGAHAMIPPVAELRASDVDAIPLPPHHTDRGETLLARDQLVQSWTKRYRCETGGEPLRMEGDPDVRLNPSQMRAMAMMLSERLSLVQGVSVLNQNDLLSLTLLQPPGTGKTRVIIETIKLLKVSVSCFSCLEPRLKWLEPLEGQLSNPCFCFHQRSCR
jgi:hypothetical protein